MSKRTRVLLALCLGAVSVGAGYGITAAVAGGPQHDAAPVPETSAANAADHGHAVRNVADSQGGRALTDRRPGKRWWAAWTSGNLPTPTEAPQPLVNPGRLTSRGEPACRPGPWT